MQTLHAELSDLLVRDAERADLGAIVEIYNQSIAGGWSTADTEAVTESDRVGWFEEHSPDRRPLWVAELDGRVVAWVALSSFYHDRPAYNATAEISTYIATDHYRRGIGRFLKQRMIAFCPEIGVTTLISIYFAHNRGTARINASLGFVPMGHLPDVAQIDGESLSVTISGLVVPSGD